MSSEFGIATRGSGEGFHSRDAKSARRAMHDENRINRLLRSMDHEKAWASRFEDPLNVEPNYFAQRDFDEARKLDEARAEMDPVVFLETQNELLASRGVIFES